MADYGCGGSPTGQCIDWHNRSEDADQQKPKEHQEKEAENNNNANECMHSSLGVPLSKGSVKK